MIFTCVCKTAHTCKIIHVCKKDACGHKCPQIHTWVKLAYVQSGSCVWPIIEVEVVGASCNSDPSPDWLRLNTPFYLVQKIITEKQSASESELLLVIRQNDNHTPGPWPRRLDPNSHQRTELSNSILGTFNRGDNRVWKCIPIPNGQGGGGVKKLHV